MGYFDRIFGMFLKTKDSPGKSRKRGRGSRRRRRVEREIRHVLDIWAKCPGVEKELVSRFPGKKAIDALHTRYGVKVVCEIEEDTKKKYLAISKEENDGN